MSDVYNLIHEKWIPVISNDGERELIAPWEVANPKWIDITAVRPDFRAALHEFLIGLFQTVCAPIDGRAWEKGLVPDRERCREQIEQVAHAFNLNGDGFRFFQDAEPELSGTKRIEQLLFESPADQTLRHNKDLFTKRRAAVEHWFSHPAIAMALLTRMLYDPGFGGGFRSGLRGRGPLTTIWKSESLWTSVWLNVVPIGTIKNTDIPDDLSTLFPWMGPCRTSEKNEETTANDLHPFAVFWGVPNRVWIEFDDQKEFRCALTDVETTGGATGLRSQQKGAHYTGPFSHCLSPHFVDVNSGRFKFRDASVLRGAGRSFKSWVGTCFETSRRNHVFRPADVVDRKLKSEGRRRVKAKLWCFGMEFKQAMALGWHEHLFPDLQFAAADNSRLGAFGERLIDAADYVVYILRLSIQRALYEQLDGGQWSNTASSIADKTFWQSTEVNYWTELDERFFDTLRVFAEDRSREQELLAEWGNACRKVAVDQFKQVVFSSDFRTADIKSAVCAKRELWAFTGPTTKKMKALLDYKEQ